ncbi:hypothetical protein FOA52_005956, partial [Chlamydomonas sp. UWO 241]
MAAGGHGAVRAHRHAHLYVVYANVVCYCTCYMMQQPLLPYLMESLGAGTAQFAAVQSLFNGAQAVGGVLSGPLLDAWGGRSLLLASFAASTVCYAMTAAAGGLGMLYASRVVTLLQHAVLAARAIVAIETSSAERGAHL